MDTAFMISAGAIACLVVLSAFFSGSETALTAASRGKLRTMADKGSRNAQRALDITEDSERLIGSVLLGNNMVNILATSLATALFTRLFGESGVALATLVMTFLVLIFAEVLPKTYAITNAETAAARVSAPIKLIILIFAPIVGAVRAFVRLLLRMFGVDTNPDAHILAFKEEIAGALSLGHSEGIVEKEDRDRIMGALDLSERTVEEIMLHRSNIEMINAQDTPETVLRQCLNSNHTRMPVFQGNAENIIGVIHAKDLLRHIHRTWEEADMSATSLDHFDINDVIKPAYFIPDTTMLDDQMREFLKRRAHFALVVDEYGALQGLITLEDILEEIVGEITDEFDPDLPKPLNADPDGTIKIDGAMTIRDVNRAMEWTLPDDLANTMAGLVIHEAQAIPSEGQIFVFHGMRFQVLERDGNRITQLGIRPLK